MMYDPTSRKDVRRMEKASRLAQREDDEIIRGIMSVAGGRSWILDKLEICHVFSSSFNVDALRMAYTEGERNIGLVLLADIMRVCPDQYTLMMQERNTKNLAMQPPQGELEEDDDGRSATD